MSWNLDKTQKLAESIAALAVVLSLLFVGYEIQQNNLVQKQAATRQIVSDWSLALASFEAPGMACLNHRFFTEPETLTLEEASVIENIYIRLFRIYEELYYQYLEGMVDESVYQGFRSVLEWYASNRGFRHWLSLYEIAFSPDFLEHLHRIISESELVTQSYYLSLECDSVVGEEYWNQ